jgi:hypothetical protein
MTRPSAAVLLVVLVAAGAIARSDYARADDTRAQLVTQMKDNCYSSNGDADPSVKAKCDCIARTFVGSLTQGEISNPKPSAAINAKIAAARRACHAGE